MSRKTARKVEKSGAEIVAAVRAKQNSAPPEEARAEDLSKVSFKIPGTLAQQILSYLQEQPFKEVFQLIQGLTRCEKLKG